MAPRDPLPPTSRYECLLKIASGGMASVFLGRLRGRYGFARLVAVKRAHAHLVEDQGLRASLVAEARLSSRIHHPNVVSVLDIDEPPGELLLVMDYVEGAALSQLLTDAPPLPAAVALRIGIDVCAGLHAAHELEGDGGEPLGMVHRDVSPHNILVGVDGVARIADFGVAKTYAAEASTTGLKGKFAYMAPEYIRDKRLDRRADIFGLGVVLWEALTGRRLFKAEGELESIQRILEHEPSRVSELVPVPAELDEPILRALAKSPEKRFPTAMDLSDALARAAHDAKLDLSSRAVAELVRARAGTMLDERAARLQNAPDRARELDATSDAATERTETGDPSVLDDDARTLPVTPLRGGRAPLQTGHGVVAEKSQTPAPSRARRAAGFGVAAAVVAGAIALPFAIARSPGPHPASTSAPAELPQAPSTGSVVLSRPRSDAAESTAALSATVTAAVANSVAAPTTGPKTRLFRAPAPPNRAETTSLEGPKPRRPGLGY